MTNKAGAIAHAGPQLIAMSLHRLFLGGLLPSRARFRFAGIVNIHPIVHSGISNMPDNLSPFSCLTHGAQSSCGKLPTVPGC